MIQPQSLDDGPQPNLPQSRATLEDFQGLLNAELESETSLFDIDNDTSMFSAEDVMLAIAESEKLASLANAVNQPEGKDVDTSAEEFDASPEGGATEPVLNSLQLHAGTIVGADDRVSRKELVSLLEGFVSVLKADGEGQKEEGRQYKVELVQNRLVEAQVDDRTQEIESLRNLVIEAQDTIIKLLTDRVEDRSKIATLQTQVQLLPDLQAQADRAMAAAVKTEEYRSELTKIKFEMDRFKLFRVRLEEGNGSLWSRIMRWFRPRLKD
ncbi:MAG TPA: hypothetical protein PKC93_05195 [Candidatus Obscuribacter sp.]|nr:hypothetical protein [Candidatus Obscuribacter sp.]